MRRKFDVRVGLMQLEYLAVYDTGSILRYWLECPEDKISSRAKRDILSRRNSLQTMLGRYISHRRQHKYRELEKDIERDQLPAELGPLYRPVGEIEFVKGKKRRMWTGAQLMYLAAEDLADPAYPCKYDLRGINVVHNYIRDFLEQRDLDVLFPADNAQVFPFRVPAPSALEHPPAALSAGYQASATAGSVADDGCREKVDTVPDLPEMFSAPDGSNLDRANDAASAQAPSVQGLPAKSYGYLGILLARFGLSRRWGRRLLLPLLCCLALTGVAYDFWGEQAYLWQTRGVAGRISADETPTKSALLSPNQADQLMVDLWHRAHDALYSMADLTAKAQPLLQSAWLSEQAKGQLILSYAALLREQYALCLSWSHAAQELFPRLHTPMPNDWRLACIYEALAHTYLRDFGAAEQALDAAQGIQNAAKHLEMVSHARSLIHMAQGRFELALVDAEAAVEHSVGDAKVASLNTLSILLALDLQLEESYRVRMMARRLNRQIGNPFESNRNMLSEYVWALKMGLSTQTVKSEMRHLERLGVQGEMRLLANYLR